MPCGHALNSVARLVFFNFVNSVIFEKKNWIIWGGPRFTAYPKSWTGPWTLDSGLWTLDSGLWTLDSGFFPLKTLSPPPKKTLYISPPPKNLYISPMKLPPPPINISSPKYTVRVFKQTTLFPHPPPPKNLYVSPLKLPPPKNPPPLPQIRNTTTLESIEQTLVVSMFFHKSALKSRTPSNDPIPIF